MPADSLPPAPVPDEDLLAPVCLLQGRRTVVLTGAGVSTESGIPDYRGPQTRRRARNPMRFAQFVSSETARRRYWARATVGWPSLADALPNAGHTAIARLEHAGVVSGVITQNVDRLHSLAGSRRVVELHGALAEVLCLDCGRSEPRASVHERLLRTNPRFAAQRAALAPDGDTELSDEAVAGFEVADCERCGGTLKPDVVYFGENVKAPVLAAAWELFHAADALLVVGSSLEVFSGRRFVMEAARRRKPVVIINLGPTRADAQATAVVDGAAGDVMPRLAQALAG